MEAQVGTEEPDYKAIRICVSCGEQDIGNYCSNCGSKLDFLGEEKTPSLQNLKNVLKEYFQEVLNPTFAYLKTIYLLLVRPLEFFQVLCFRDKPINDIPFPLNSLWSKVSGKSATQYTLHPVAFYTSNFVITIISGAITLIFLLGLSVTGQFQLDDLPSIPALSSAGLFTLLYMLASAFIFDLLTQESKIPPQFKYSFWVYVFSLVWISWLVGLFVLIVLLPFFLILGCILICCLIVIYLLVTLDSTASANLFSTLLTTYTTLAGYAGVFFAGIGGVYIFWKIPREVFSNIYQKKGISTNNLWVKILASLIIPAIPVILCYFPFLISQLPRY